MDAFKLIVGVIALCAIAATVLIGAGVVFELLLEGLEASLK
ncbi:hypothetical protein [Methylocystis sp.]|nr:hypothetical protein [Methylocystis sp.]MDP3554818.1 hypothetical protein [Methylocystis sp.]